MKDKKASRGVRYITTPIYYVNDKPHIGHVYTTLVADVLSRWWRARGDDVFFLTGTDEHGAKIAESAQEAGVSVEEFTERQRQRFKDAFAKLDVAYDAFISTTDEAHERQVGVFLEKLKERSVIYAGEYRGLYCTGCEDFYTEKDLIDGTCPIHKRKPEEIAEKNYFFKLSQFVGEVGQRIRDRSMLIEPAARRNEVLALLRDGMPDFSISREKVQWGIPFPGDQAQTVYVWVEALQNYITALGALDGDARFEKYWPHSLHLIGKDILKFHAIWWPALLLAAGMEPPKRIFAHGFFTVNGQKMSKSLGNVIDPLALAEKYGVDAARYLLLSQFPFGDDGDVQEAKFDEKYNADLANGIGNLVSRVLTMVTKFCGGEAPEAIDGVTDLPKRCTETRDAVSAAFEALRLYEALGEIRALATAADETVDREKPWELAKNDATRLSAVLADLLTVLAELSVLLAPFMPEAAKKIAVALGRDGTVGDGALRLPKGRALHAVPSLFPRRQKG